MLTITSERFKVELLELGFGGSPISNGRVETEHLSRKNADEPLKYFEVMSIPNRLNPIIIAVDFQTQEG